MGIDAAFFFIVEACFQGQNMFLSYDRNVNMRTDGAFPGHYIISTRARSENIIISPVPVPFCDKKTFWGPEKCFSSFLLFSLACNPLLYLFSWVLVTTLLATWLYSQSQSQSQSQSPIATDGQSISKSWCRAPSGAHDQIFITL
jgi:hypothetical protein